MNATNISAEPKPSITDLLIRAKVNIGASKDHLRLAAEDIAAAKEQGATQRQIAETVGKSPAWVNGLLRWRKAGYQDTAFGPQAKAQRQRIQATKQRRQGIAPAIEIEQHFDAEQDRLDAEAVATIARLRKDLPDNEDVIALCDYTERYITGGCGMTYEVVQTPDERACTRQ